MTEGKVVKRLLHRAPQCFASMPLVRERCVLATRIGIDVLARFGIEAEPRSVACAVSNQAYEQWRCWLAEDPTRSSDTPPPGAWSVIAGLPNDMQPAPPKFWHGHLVVFLPRRACILDLDFQQFERPRLGVKLPASLALPWEPGRPTTGAMIEAFDAGGAPHGTFFAHYEHAPENQAFRSAPDWDSDRDTVRAAVDAITRAIRKGGDEE